MRRTAILLTIAFQFLVLGYMAANQELIRTRGRTVYLKTAPVDPRDLFRGDYVRLSYEISTVSKNLLRGDLPQHMEDKGYKVYTVLKTEPDRTAEILYVTDRKPEQGIFIRGRIAQNWRLRSSGRAVGIHYGIESYFVQQGKGLEMERKRGGPGDVQIPMEMAVAVDQKGSAVIKGHRWSDLGIGIRMIRTAGRSDGEERDSAAVEVTLMNASDSPLLLADTDDHRYFRLVPVVWAKEAWELAHPPAGPRKSLQREDLIRLEPGEKRSIQFDLTSPHWHVIGNEGIPKELGELPLSEMFRWVYQSPAPEDVDHLDVGGDFWQGSIRSRAFHGRGAID